mgnify:CR=1 FL=1
MTVFLTTHYMEEAEEADYCVVVDDGTDIISDFFLQMRSFPYLLSRYFQKHIVHGAFYYRKAL